MKALIISDDENFISTLDDFFHKYSIDTIIYKWLLKALDNIEEIHPDIIVLSANEYPRHWKTLVQFVKSGIGGDDVSIFLYEQGDIPSEDIEKIKLLGINGVFKALDETSLEIIKPEQTRNIIQNMILTNPVTNSIVTGTVTEQSDNKVFFEADFEQSCYGLNSGDKLDFITITCNDECTECPAVINTIDRQAICLEIVYEER